MSKDIEGIVETLNDKLVEANCNNFGECYVAYEEREDICNWLRATLKSQADKYEREKCGGLLDALKIVHKKEKEEMVREIQEELQNPSFAGVMDSNETRRGYQVGIAEATSLVIDVAKKYGVDLPE